MIFVKMSLTLGVRGRLAEKKPETGMNRKMKLAGQIVICHPVMIMAGMIAVIFVEDGEETETMEEMTVTSDVVIVVALGALIETIVVMTGDVVGMTGDHQEKDVYGGTMDPEIVLEEMEEMTKIIGEVGIVTSHVVSETVMVPEGHLGTGMPGAQTEEGGMIEDQGEMIAETEMMVEVGMIEGKEMEEGTGGGKKVVDQAETEVHLVTGMLAGRTVMAQEEKYQRGKLNLKKEVELSDPTHPRKLMKMAGLQSDVKTFLLIISHRIK